MKQFEETKKILANSVLFYIITTGMDGNYSYINQHYAKEFKHVSENFVGEPYHITMHPDDMKTCEEVSMKCFQNPKNLYPATIRKLDGKGGYIYTQWEYKAMFDGQSNPAGIFCLGYNITKFVADEQKLETTQIELQKNLNIIETITFQQSHLIRSPLSNIVGLVSNLDRDTMDSNNRGICDMILESSNQLDKVVRSIVNVART